MLCDTADRARHGSPSGEGWRTAPAQEDAGAARCAAHARLAATPRHASEKGRRLSALSRTRSDWSAPGHVSPAAGLMDLRCRM